MRKKRMPSRRQKALRWCGALVLALALFPLLGLYCPFPSQAADLMADKQDLQDVETVLWYRDQELRQSNYLRRPCLIANEDALVFFLANFNGTYGWNSGVWMKVETWTDAGLYAGIMGYRPEGAAWLAGKLKDPDIESLTLTMPDGEAREISGTYMRYGQDGARYFVVPLAYEKVAVDASTAEMGCERPVFTLTGFDEEQMPRDTVVIYPQIWW